MRKGKLIYYITTAAIFIILEVAALTMLNNNGAVQRTWFGKAGQGFMNFVWGTSQSISDYFSLKEQNDALAAENSRLTILLAAQQDSLVRDSLMRMVPENGIVGDFQYTPAVIRKISSNTQHNYIILDKGSNDGVDVGCGVITAKGAVGIIDAVSDNFSYARSFQNHQMNVSARLKKDGPVGTMSWNGVNMKTAILKDIPHHIAPSPGDTVYTSGFSSIFPADIPLGTTQKAKIVNGATYEIEVSLFEDYKALRYVLVVNNLGKKEISALEENM